MSQFDKLSQELQKLVPFRIRYKDESWEMQLLNLFVLWFCPSFLTNYTTVIGSTIYFPNRSYIHQHPESAMRTLAHEVVHLADASKWSFPLFSAAYLFPQILVLGVLSFPLLGFWALLFLLFAFPIPAPFRFYFESRAYALDLLTTPELNRKEVLHRVSKHFGSWDYYRMYPFPDQVQSSIQHWADKAESGEDKTLLKVLLVYELVSEA
ncbi:MAG: hypothetical protein AAF587_12030 [Bacteroidota bacterium]